MKSSLQTGYLFVLTNLPGRAAKGWALPCQAVRRGTVLPSSFGGATAVTAGQHPGTPPRGHCQQAPAHTAHPRHLPGHELHQPLVEETSCGETRSEWAPARSSTPLRQPLSPARTCVLPVEAAALLRAAPQLLGADNEEPVPKDGGVHGLREEAALGGRAVARPACCAVPSPARLGPHLANKRMGHGVRLEQRQGQLQPPRSAPRGRHGRHGRGQRGEPGRGRDGAGTGREQGGAGRGRGGPGGRRRRCHGDGGGGAGPGRGPGRGPGGRLGWRPG